MHQQLARRLRHEIGDFLQKLYATVAILQQRLPEDFGLERDLLTRLRARAENCRHLVDEIQDFLCPITLHCEHTDLAELAGRLVAKASARHPGIDIKADGDTAVYARVDPARMAQVGEVLLTNACESGSRQVRFTSRQLPETGEVEWIVSDNGSGVASELEAQLFTPFFTTRTVHAGLGLTLVRKIVELHHGRVEAENSPGKGFSVTVRLPIGT